MGYVEKPKLCRRCISRRHASNDNSILVQEPSLRGPIRNSSDPCGVETGKENDSTTKKILESFSDAKTCQKRKSSGNDTSTPVSVAKSRKRICAVKSKPSNTRSPITQSSPTLAPGSTSQGKDLGPFWNRHSSEWSRKLWSCTVTDCRDLPSTSWNGSLKRLGQKSWFTVRAKQGKTAPKLTETSLPTIYSPSLPFLWQAITVDGAQKINAGDKDETGTLKIAEKQIRRIRIYPTVAQKETLTEWLGAVRWTYNRCVAGVVGKTCDSKQKNLRVYTVHNATLEKDMPWITRVPYQIRDEAMRDYLKGLKETTRRRIQQSVRALWKDVEFQRKKKTDQRRIVREAIQTAKDTAPAKMALRTLKNGTQQSLVIPSVHWGRKKGIYAALFGRGRIRASQQLPVKLGGDSRLIRTKWGAYYILAVEPIVIQSESQAPKSNQHSTISVDPGVRSFMTGYDADGRVFEWGANDCIYLRRIHRHLDELKKRSACKDWCHHRRYKMKQAMQRMRLKIRNRVVDLHKKLAKWLCETYRCVVIPKFGVSKMVRKRNRRIGRQTTREMHALSHYKFRQILLNKARSYPWVKIIVTEEPWTSKTCSHCGWIHMNLGASHHFICQACTSVFGRDTNAAKNIVVRYLTQHIGGILGSNTISSAVR